ncbi:MAG: hypothetical protein EOO42_03040 [Flavobacteriales bacterium]|nr:MAG: hypothetical protein EOO42_03040 [Flavobacteriales bacterium]
MKAKQMKFFYTYLLFVIFGFDAVAQKLPDIQSSKITAPTSVRMDGKLQEWNGFAAENRRADLFYTIANDEKNLYLVIKATNNEAITKIMSGGVSFTVNTKGRKKEGDGYTITYPTIVRNSVGRTGGQGQNRQRMGQGRTEQTQVQRDSLALVQRKAQLAGIKEIKISGFKNIPDSLVSIYNEHGIKAVGKMDEQGAYVYEMAIPFALMDVNINDVKEFAYQIKLNGRSDAGNFTMRTNAGGGGFGGGNRGNFGGGNANTARQDLMVATDFWGKYIFQK